MKVFTKKLLCSLHPEPDSFYEPQWKAGTDSVEVFLTEAGLQSLIFRKQLTGVPKSLVAEENRIVLNMFQEATIIFPKLTSEQGF